ncbi:MAG: MotA/TolQ/ExbB proton channel family protein [Bacteroidota bacterium]|nr:MotA/TolQ/ExbB proton channel family protein [Bacteroidota bacterium]
MTNETNVLVENNSKVKSSNVVAGVIIAACLIIGVIIWKYVMGSPSNFEGGDPENGHPLPGNILGMVYKGGYVVPVLMGLLLMTFVFSIERYFVISKASGKGQLDKFVAQIKSDVADGNIQAAIDACDEQQGSVANAIRSALVKYQEVKREGFNSEEAEEAIQKELEQATSLEMPMLEKNMTVLATLVSIGTLVGLLGTVSGMIKAFSGLATSGAPDQAALANGISEALINTATGIATSTVATISYNLFTSKIDTLTYFIDEAGNTITQAYRRARGVK